MTPCECGKVRYLTRGEARKRARSFQGKRLGKVRAYCCEGGFWHLTSATANGTAFHRNARSGGTS